MSVRTVRTSKELVEAARVHLSETNTNAANSGTTTAVSLQKAGDLLSSAVQQDPTFVNALLLRSGLASRVGQLAAATADASLAIEADRGSTDTRRVAALYGTRSGLLARAGRAADAVADLRAALRCEPDNGAWAFELGRAYLKEGRVGLAQHSFQQALQEPMWSHVNEAMRPRVYAQYGRSCLMSRDYKKAKALLHKALEVGGDGAAVLHDVGLAHYYEGTSPTAAIEFFARATEKDSQAVAYPMHLGLAHVRCGNANDALSSMNEAVLRGRDDPRLRFYRGCIELQLGLGPQALADLTASAELARSAAPDGCVRGAVRKGAATPATVGTTSTSVAATWVAMALVHIFCDSALPEAASCLEVALRHAVDGQQRVLAAVLLGSVRLSQGNAFAAVRVLSDALAAMRSAGCDGARPPKAEAAHHTQSGSAASTSSAAGITTAQRFHADMEQLALTLMGLGYTACGYTDLALRYFSHARQRAELHGNAAQMGGAIFRHAVALAELHDTVGVLAALRAAEMAALSTLPVAGKSDLSGAMASAAPVGEPPASSTQAGPPSLLVMHRHETGETAHLYAVTLRRLGRLSEALQYASQALQAPLRSDDGAFAASATVPAYLYNRALIHFLLRHYAEAMADVQLCLSTSAASADALYLQGCIAHATADYAAALECLTAALELDGSLRTVPVFSYSRGVLLAIAGRLSEAAEAFSDAIAHGASARDGVTCPVVYYHERAKVHQQLRHYAEALADYDQVLPARVRSSASEPPSSAQAVVNWNALVNRSLTLKELQRYTDAAADWDLALRLDTSGALSQLTSQDVFELAYVELCLPGCELYA